MEVGIGKPDRDTLQIQVQVYHENENTFSNTSLSHTHGAYLCEPLEMFAVSLKKMLIMSTKTLYI